MSLNPLFVQQSPLGSLTLQALKLPHDIEVIQRWVNLPYARHWGLLNATFDEVLAYYGKLTESSHHKAYIGLVNQQPAFLMESYDPQFDEVSCHYSVKEGDVGMHLLLSPADRPQQHFSYHIIKFVLQFLFEANQAKRIVVEPDISNHKIHKLNKKVGFHHQRQIQMANKTAYLAFCDPRQFASATGIYRRIQQKAIENLADDPATAIKQLDKPVWQTVNRLLVGKMLAEFSHERLLQPVPLGTKDGKQRYQLINDEASARYEFSAKLMALDHWLIDPDSINKWLDNQAAALDGVLFILEFCRRLNINQNMLATYLEEISSTLLSGAYKFLKTDGRVNTLVDASFEHIEVAMTEGHPSFIANNGRIGFDAKDYHAYAPETGSEIQLLWLAAAKNKVSFSACAPLDYDSLIAGELDVSLIDHFNRLIESKHRLPEDYLFFPVHPWQWYNKLVHIFATDIAQQQLICLGYGDDQYLAQQSIRTFYNISDPHKHYVKTALSILNMGFMRGLSTHYMRTTPAINQWVYDLVEQDAYLKQTGFKVLREIAAIGYKADYYDAPQLGDNPYKKMLAALWRESPTRQLKNGEKLMTMAALLHIDNQQKALLPALILSSGLTAKQWTTRYLDVYLSPLLHCFYQHKLVFMPHGENLIMVLKNNTPVSAFIKDIGEEICLLNGSTQLPSDVQRIAVTMPENMALLSIFTDVFDGIFRYISAILLQHMALPETDFWYLVAQCVHRYQQHHPHLAVEFAKYDLFAPSFAHSCLNRLQLQNNKQMVDLTDPAASLKFAGTLNNPIHIYRHNEIATVKEAELA